MKRSQSDAMDLRKQKWIVPLNAHHANPGMQRCLRGISQVQHSLSGAFAYLSLSGTFNAGLGRLRADREAADLQGEKPAHPYLTLAFGDRWARHQQAGATVAGRAPGQADISAIQSELADELAPLRGRPPQDLLRYHLHALMLLVREMTGVMPAASMTRDSVYEAHMTTLGGELIVQALCSVDPNAQLSMLVGFVIQANRSGELERRAFDEFFPFEIGAVDAQTGRPILKPGMRLDHFQPMAPIYIS